MAGLSKKRLKRRVRLGSLSRTGDLAGNAAQAHRAGLVDPHQQPDEIADLGDPLGGAQLPVTLKPGMIEAVDRHGVTPCVKGLGKTILLENSCRSISLSVVKVSSR